MMAIKKQAIYDRPVRGGITAAFIQASWHCISGVFVVGCLWVLTVAGVRAGAALSDAGEEYGIYQAH
jgi:hypothetical protein